MPSFVFVAFYGPRFNTEKGTPKVQTERAQYIDPDAQALSTKEQPRKTIESPIKLVPLRTPPTTQPQQKQTHSHERMIQKSQEIKKHPDPRSSSKPRNDQGDKGANKPRKKNDKTKHSSRAKPQNSTNINQQTERILLELVSHSFLHTYRYILFFAFPLTWHYKYCTNLLRFTIPHGLEFVMIVQEQII